MVRVLLAVLGLVLCVSSSRAESRPDIMLILLDDSGWTDFGCYGSRIQTPRIDRFASQGMKMTDCHSAAPNCSPSRAGLLTGRTPSRVGIYSYLPAEHVMHLRDREITIAEQLRDAGYRTGHFGKWHLSRLMSSQPDPSDQGFEYSLGTDNNASPSHRNPINFVRNGKRVGEMQGYSCQLVVDEAVGWLKSAKEETPDRPTFTCVWFHEPHSPIASPMDLVEKYRKLDPTLSTKQATYYANIENVDRAVGRLLDELAELGMDESSFIFLTSDNGPLNAHSKMGLRGQKSHVWEGGHRVPGLFRWPGRIQPGSVSGEPISGVDFFPTACAVAGIQPPEGRHLDGCNLLPLLTGEGESFRREQPLYWFFYRLNPSLALREGRWVLIADSNDAGRKKTHALIREDMDYIQSSRPEQFELFDLGGDLGQRKDLSREKPKVLADMTKKLREVHRDVLAEAPRWEIPSDYGATAKKKIWSSR